MNADNAACMFRFAPLPKLLQPETEFEFIPDARERDAEK